MRVPGVGASCLGAGRPGTGALRPPTTRPFGRAAGAHYPLAVGAGDAGVGTRHQPHSAPFCELALRAVGAARGRPGGRLLPGCGASGDGRSPTPDHPSFRACSRGPLPDCRGCGVRSWGPGCPWHLVPCRGSSCVVRASWVRGTWWLLWLRTRPRALVVARGVPLWRVSWPRIGAPLLVRSGRSSCSGRLSRRRVVFPQPGGRRPRLYLVAARGTWRPAENQAHCACRWPLPGPACVCVCVPCLPGPGGPASQARSGAPQLSFGRSRCALCLFGPLRAGVAPFVVVVGFFSFSFPLYPPLLRPRCVLLCVFSGPGCLGPWHLFPPPPFFYVCVPPRGTGAVNSPAGLGTGQPRFA